MAQEKAPVAIVTGAGRGIGAAVARRLKTAGYNLALMSPSDNVIARGEELSALAVKGSITEPGDIERVVAETLRAYGRIDALVNNCGHAPGSSGGTGPSFSPETLEEPARISDADWQAGFEMMFLSVVRVSSCVLDVMRDQGGGSIVNISSFVADEPRLTYLVSSAIRGAVSNYTKLFADRYARDGVRMNSVLPGFLENWPLGEEVYRFIPMGRPGTLDEVGDLVRFLVSDESRYITGQNILIDGGVNRRV